MAQLYQRGLSRTNGGGTLKTYAKNISHLIRYCYKNKIDFIDLSDNEFTFFIKSLQGEKHFIHSLTNKRDTNTILNIGRNCLDFLISVGYLYSNSDFVGPKGRIVIRNKEFSFLGKGGRKRITRKYLHHHSFPTPDIKKQRLPITDKLVQKLRNAIYPLGSSTFIRARRYAMLQLLEMTGCRRAELIGVTVKSIKNAMQMKEPILKLPSLKSNKEYRLIPVFRPDLRMLIQYIDKNRKRVIRRTCGLSNDGGELFINENTGKSLVPDTINGEFGALCKQAGIQEKAHPHLFRHQFITKLFIRLIEQHDIENEDSFRKHLLDTETMKQKVMEWTGHSSIESLNIYIHLAVDEVASYTDTRSAIKLRQSADGLERATRQIIDEMKHGEISIAAASIQLERCLDGFQKDKGMLYG